MLQSVHLSYELTYNYIFPDLSYNIVMYMLFTSITISAFFIVHMFRHLYPNEVPRALMYIALVIGSGISGLLHVQLAKYKGVREVVAADINPYRLRMAEKFGVQHTIDAKESLPKKLREINNGRLADKVVVCTGATQAALTALECVDKGGSILFFAVPEPTVKLPVPITEFWRNEIMIKTSYGAAPNDLEESLAILARKKVNVKDMITHRLSLQQVAEGFRLMAEAGTSLKVIIEPNRN